MSLYWDHQWTHHARTTVDDEIRAMHITTEPTRQKASHPTNLRRQPGPFKANVRLLRGIALHLRRRQLCRHAPLVEPVQTDPDVDLAGANTVYPHARAFQNRHARPDHSQCRVARHCEAGTPAAAVGRGGGAHDDNAAIFLVFWCGVWVVAFARGLGHGVRRPLQGVEGREGVGFEALL